MKQYLSISFLLMVCTGTSSQTVKGLKALGDGIPYTQTTLADIDDENREASKYSLFPRFLVKRNFAYSVPKNKGCPEGETALSDFAFGPLARYIFGFNVAPGFAFCLNHYWTPEFRRIGFSNIDTTTEDDDEIKSLTTGWNSLSPSPLGIRYHI